MKTFSEIITFANAPTGSGQIYTTDLLQTAFDVYMSKDKDLRHGCLDAPAGGVVSLDRISHYLLETWWEENALWGTVEIAEHLPMGKIFSQLVDVSPETMTLGLAAMATFQPANAVVESRDLFKEYNDDEFSQEVDDMAVITVYALPKVNTNH